MLKKLQVLMALISTVSYAAAGTVSIGTASARGDMRVDSYKVNGNATLFDGSVVETGQATADLRLAKGTQITMSTDAKGVLYQDRLVLQQGESQIAASPSFRVEANGLNVNSSDPNSRAVVSMKAENTVEVAALSGSVEVTNAQGMLLANIKEGRVASFAMQAGTPPSSFSGVGMVSFTDGHYFLTTDENIKYELVGEDFKKYVGMKIQVDGTLQSANGVGGVDTIHVKHKRINGAAAWPAASVLLITGASLGGAAAVGYAIYEVNQPKTPASP